MSAGRNGAFGALYCASSEQIPQSNSVSTGTPLGGFARSGQRNPGGRVVRTQIATRSSPDERTQATKGIALTALLAEHLAQHPALRLRRLANAEQEGERRRDVSNAGRPSIGPSLYRRAQP